MLYRTKLLLSKSFPGLRFPLCNTQPTQFANVVCHQPHMPHHTTVCTDIMKLMKHDDSTWLDVCSTVAWRICYGIPPGRIRFACTANPRRTLFSVSDSDNKDLDHLVQRKLRECDIQAWVPAWQSHLWWQSLSRCVCYRCCPPSARHRWLPLELAVKPLNSWNAWTNMLVNLPTWWCCKASIPSKRPQDFLDDGPLKSRKCLITTRIDTSEIQIYCILTQPSSTGLSAQCSWSYWPWQATRLITLFSPASKMGLCKWKLHQSKASW